MGRLWNRCLELFWNDLAQGAHHRAEVKSRTLETPSKIHPSPANQDIAPIPSTHLRLRPPSLHAPCSSLSILYLKLVQRLCPLRPLSSPFPASLPSLSSQSYFMSSLSSSLSSSQTCSLFSLSNSCPLCPLRTSLPSLLSFSHLYTIISFSPIQIVIAAADISCNMCSEKPTWDFNTCFQRQR